MNDEAQPTAEFDAFSNTYDRAVNDSIAFSGLKVDFFTRVKAAYLLDLIRAHFGSAKDASVLDIGCGVGNFHPLLVDEVASVDGVDVSASSVAEAQRRNSAANYQAYDGERLPYRDDSFDVAFTVCVMHHVPPQKWPAFVAEAKRVVKPGGLFAVFEHNPYNPLTRHVVSNCEFDKNANLLVARETRGLLEMAGFRKVEDRFILAIPPINAALRKVDSMLGRLPIGAQYYVKATA